MEDKKVSSSGFKFTVVSGTQVWCNYKVESNLAASPAGGNMFHIFHCTSLELQISFKLLELLKINQMHTHKAQYHPPPKKAWKLALIMRFRSGK
jgi:hypothetical protein